MITQTYPDAREQFVKLAGAFGTMTADERVGDVALTDDDLTMVGDVVRAADGLIATIEGSPAAEIAETDELLALARALRRMAALVLANHTPDQAWFWTPEWQAGERQADSDKVAGRFTRYESGEAFLAALREARPDVADRTHSSLYYSRGNSLGAPASSRQTSVTGTIAACRRASSDRGRLEASALRGTFTDTAPVMDNLG